ncbi:hypothetical protein JTB14_029942 [Gonioctena quinquepunctata]|nr:hypothetical protein JTB14_029942 [Gonioctena quinquepunctata]
MNRLRHVLRSSNTFVENISRTFSANVEKSIEGELDKLYEVVELELRGNDPAVLKSFSKFAVTTGNHLDINTASWSLRKPTHDRYTVLKSVHIYKKHRVQYEIRTYYSFVQYKHLTGSTADTLLEYIERNLPEGIALKATKVELQELPEHLISHEKSGAEHAQLS